LLLIQKAVHRAPAHRPGCGRLQRECLKLLREHERNGDIPTHGRFLFYELEQRGVIPKKYAGVNPRMGKNSARTPLQDVSVATVHLREVGLVPWHWIEDESLWSYAASVADYVRAAIDRARIDLWQGEEPPPIICESRCAGATAMPWPGTMMTLPAFFIGNAAVVGRALLDRPLLHRAAGRAGRLAAETAEDDGEEAAVHALAHDVGQDGA
jgi:hypothetical protein